jgi:subtilisin-like proprotein convertase family protein
MFIVILTLLLAATVFSQSTDANNPTLLASRAINLDHRTSDKEYFYSFLVGKGTITITVDGEMRYTGGIIVTLQSPNGNFIDNFSVSAYADKTVKGSQSFKFASGQRVVLKLEPGDGDFKLRIDGSAYREKAASVKPNDPDELPILVETKAAQKPKKKRT